jgi:hypothetical protein
MGENFKDALGDDQSLKVFLENMKQFENDFCRLMFSGKDFTLRLEIRGDKNKLLHCRVSRDHWDRP